MIRPRTSALPSQDHIGVKSLAIVLGAVALCGPSVQGTDGDVYVKKDNHEKSPYAENQRRSELWEDVQLNRKRTFALPNTTPPADPKDAEYLRKKIWLDDYRFDGLIFQHGIDREPPLPPNQQLELEREMLKEQEKARRLAEEAEEKLKATARANAEEVRRLAELRIRLLMETAEKDARELRESRERVLREMNRVARLREEELNILKTMLARKEEELGRARFNVDKSAYAKVLAVDTADRMILEAKAGSARIDTIAEERAKALLKSIEDTALQDSIRVEKSAHEHQREEVDKKSKLVEKGEWKEVDRVQVIKMGTEESSLSVERWQATEAERLAAQQQRVREQLQNEELRRAESVKTLRAKRLEESKRILEGRGKALQRVGSPQDPAPSEGDTPLRDSRLIYQENEDGSLKPTGDAPERRRDSSAEKPERDPYRAKLGEAVSPHAEANKIQEPVAPKERPKNIDAPKLVEKPKLIDKPIDAPKAVNKPEPMDAKPIDVPKAESRASRYKAFFKEKLAGLAGANPFKRPAPEPRPEMPETKPDLPENIDAPQSSEKPEPMDAKPIDAPKVESRASLLKGFFKEKLASLTSANPLKRPAPEPRPEVPAESKLLLRKEDLESVQPPISREATLKKRIQPVEERKEEPESGVIPHLFLKDPATEQKGTRRGGSAQSDVRSSKVNQDLASASTTEAVTALNLAVVQPDAQVDRHTPAPAIMPTSAPITVPTAMRAPLPSLPMPLPRPVEFASPASAPVPQPEPPRQEPLKANASTRPMVRQRPAVETPVPVIEKSAGRVVVPETDTPKFKQMAKRIFEQVKAAKPSRQAPLEPEAEENPNNPIFIPPSEGDESETLRRPFRP